jgi:transketolase
VDGHDPEAINKAIHDAKSVNDRPTLICTRTVIGYGAPNLCGSHDCHGAPLGDDEIKAARENLGWNHAPFEIPDDIYAGWDGKAKGQAAEQAWDDKFAAYRKAHPELAAEFERRMAGELPADWAQQAAKFVASVNDKAETIASRKASQNALNGYGPLLPEFLGGSADLAGSNLTIWSGSKGISNTVSDGNYIYYGVREFGMSAMMNGIALHGGFIPYGATFLMFSEYARNALRMAALMKVPSIFVYTHDSIGLGEDGPTHQPIEQTATLRMIPNMSVWRPCDAVESAVAWKVAIERKDGPTCLIFSRQNLAHQSRSAEQLADIERGGYILKDCDGTPDAIVIATGSEVALAMGAAEQLSGKKVRVVSMPCTDLFDAQDEAYRESVLPSSVAARVAVEAGVTDYWLKYVGLSGKVIGINRFGESAPAGELFKHFGFTAENVAAAVEAVMA